jgi:hypothetical protein
MNDELKASRGSLLDEGRSEEGLLSRGRSETGLLSQSRRLKERDNRNDLMLLDNEVGGIEELRGRFSVPQYVMLPSRPEQEDAAPSEQSFDGELWVMGYHLYDDTNFSPDNTNGGTIGGTYSGAEWIESDLSGSNPSASYSATGPSSASWDANKAWVKLSEAGGAGRYVYHLPSGARQSDLLRWDATNSHWIKLTGPDADGKKYVLMADNGVLSWVEAEEMTCT